jgi:hypothetical protein
MTGRSLDAPLPHAPVSIDVFYRGTPDGRLNRRGARA